jgi:endonuclease/exonuclease/phosphatase family metal-dependent hydrolase
MRVLTWNLLHGIALTSPDSAQSLSQVASELTADLVGLQEVDRDQSRSNYEHQTQVVAQAMGLGHWIFAPAIVGTPGESWETATDSHLHKHDSSDPGHSQPHYGVGLASRFPFHNIEVMRFKAAPISLPLIIPGNPKPQVIKVADEPRVAIIADVETPTGVVTVATTHLSFVPGYNVKQLRKLTKYLALRPNPVLIFGDFNLPGKISSLVTRWDSLAALPTYPTFKPRVQFDHVLAKGYSKESIESARNSAHSKALTISDHCALVVEVS